MVISYEFVHSSDAPRRDGLRRGGRVLLLSLHRCFNRWPYFTNNIIQKEEGKGEIMNAMSKLLIIAIFAMSLVSCGGGGNSGTGTPIAVAPSETLAPEVDGNSYLPLSAGIETSFSDGPLSEDGSITVQGLKVQVTEDGVIKMSGRKVYSDGYADVEETLKCTEEGGAIFLTGSEIDASYSDGSSRANSRTYDPPVTILADKSSLSEGGVFETEHLAVDFDGDPDAINV